MCQGTFKIVSKEVLWSVRGSDQTMRSPLPNITRHSGEWPYTVTSSIYQTLHQFLTLLLIWTLTSRTPVLLDLHELAHRLRVAQPTLMDVPIFLIYFYITIYVCVPHFYDLSALVGYWSSVSIRRIIYKFLNVCPFDYTTVAVSGKVERS